MKKPKGSKKRTKQPKGGFSALRKARNTTADDFALQAEQEDDAPPETAPAKPVKLPPNALDEIVSAAFDAATTPPVRRRLAHGQALAAVVTVPALSWVDPLAHYLKKRFGGRWKVYVRGSDRKDSTAGSYDAAYDLSHGYSTMGIAVDAGRLPASLTVAPDIEIRIAAPGPAELKRAITRFCRRSPGTLPDGIGAGLDVYELAAAFRPGKGPRDVVRRLATTRTRHAATAGGPVPALATAVEYGEAQRWGLGLARDIADFRDGRIEWKDVDRGICLHGAPGTGKSLFARILAQACGIPLVATSVAQ